MSSPFSSEHFAGIRDASRDLLERTRDHEGRLNGFVQTAEGVARFMKAKIVAHTGNGWIPSPLAQWFVAIVSKSSSRDVVVAAVQNAATV